MKMDLDPGNTCPTEKTEPETIYYKNKKKKKICKLIKIENEIKSDDSLLHSDPSARSFVSFFIDKIGGSGDNDTDSEPDRSNPLWKIQLAEEKEDEPSQEAVVSTEKIKTTLWEDIMIEYEDKRQEYFTQLELERPIEPPVPVCQKLSAVQYLEKYIFPLLCPVLEETLFKAKEWDCLTIQKCRFNGLDYIAELLWNKNPLHPRRHEKQRDIFDIPFVIIWLYYNPRPVYPLSWLWSKTEAITVLQTYIRRFLVCNERDCSEMRQFWKTIKMENKEEKSARKEKLIYELDVMFNEIIDKLIADAVFDAEWKLNGCRCVKKPCHCVCNCMKWCKCCNCYKIQFHNAAACSCSKLITDVKQPSI